MKRLVSLMLALALCLMGLAVAEAADVTGVWYLNVIEADGMQLDPALAGMELTITLNADGSAELGANGETQTGCSWSMADGVVQISDPSGDAISAVPDGESLVVADEESGINMILGREKTAVENYVPAAVEAAPALQDFEGTWKAAIIDMMGMQMGMDAIGMQLVIEISGTNAVVTSNESGASETYNAPVSLEGDTLSVASMGEEMPMYLQLLQDGKLVWAEDNDGLVISMYFEKIA